VKNSLGLLAVVDAMCLDVEAFAQSFADLDPEPGRGRRRRLVLRDGEAVLIDDSYNANPASVRAALEVLGRAPGRKLAALGAMKELGRDSRAMHAELKDAVLAADVALVFTVGDEMHALVDALPAARRGDHGATAEALIQPVRATLSPGDTLLVKGSLASGMGRLVTALVEGRP
jgi:UDP-N-acetylmuramoyl-tripeptide--D-alanyl-D-alanine ligase